MKNLSIILSLVLIAVFVADFGCDPSIHAVTRTSIRPLYVLHHAGILHLAINVYCLLSMVFCSEARLWHFSLSVLFACFLPPAIITAPTVGFSTVLYAMSGILIMQSPNARLLILLNLSTIAIQFVFSSMAVTAHLYCFLMGIVSGFLFNPTHNE